MLVSSLGSNVISQNLALEIKLCNTSSSEQSNNDI